MRREEGIPMRCHRCGGTGDVPIITEATQFYPDARPLLTCCPGCGGSGFGREGGFLELEEVETEAAAEIGEQAPKRRRARK